jgi:hypothetical protein
LRWVQACLMLFGIGVGKEKEKILKDAQNEADVI